MSVFNFLKDLVAIGGKISGAVVSAAATGWSIYLVVRKILNSKEAVLLGFVRASYLETEVVAKATPGMTSKAKAEYFANAFTRMYRDKYRSDPIPDLLAWAKVQADKANPKLNPI